MSWDDMALVGRIARAHGNRGQVIVNLDTDFPEERFRPGTRLSTMRGGVLTTLTLTTVRFHAGRPVIGLEGIDTMDAAESLAGLELRIPAAQLVPLPPGTFYEHDLVGCRVETRTGVAVGVVQRVEGTAGASRLVVSGTNGEVLIPLANEICTTIDVSGRRIVVDPPEGLLDLNA
jgi:16S rRNA processing protein RimM